MAEDRLTVNLAPELVNALEQLAVRNGTHWTEELRRAISDRSFFSYYVQAGQTITLVDDEGLKTVVNFR